MARRAPQPLWLGHGAAVSTQVTWDEIAKAAKTHHLNALGGFHPIPEDDTPEGTRTLILLGPGEPGFWPHVQTSPEWLDGTPDPIDRWSKRVLGAFAGAVGATPIFPFGGPPYHPFFRWAERSGRIKASPIMFLVHDQAGLFVSFRGALAFGQHIDLPTAPPQPCETCAEQPCRTACPVDAFDGTNYDVATCKAYLNTEPGADCMENGCRARRACPTSQSWGRLPAQSAYHMRHFRG